MQVPESTRPLLRQVEAMQDAEAKAAAAKEKEHSVNEYLSKTFSRINVLEAQVLWFYSFNLVIRKIVQIGA
ncbi:hypothetical protein Hanom_Chr10g00962441 [Helianthus anomalus]